MLREFKSHIEKHFPFLWDSKAIVACSGGVDSVVLAHLCINCGLEIGLAHCNFKLRNEESDGDENFVKNLGDEFRVPVFVSQFEAENYGKVKQLSIQMAARELRYDWFQTLIKEDGYDYVLTAHQADDNLETFFINLARGSGVEGLTGIPSKNGSYVRPLLPFSRKNILLFAEQNGIVWREDSSNKHTKYLRNKLRHEVIPALKQVYPGLLHNFKKTIGHLEDSKQLIHLTIAHLRETLFEVDDKEPETIRIAVKKLKALQDPKVYIYHLLKDYGFSAWDDILKLLVGQTGKKVVSSKYRLIRDRDYLLLAPNPVEDEVQYYQIFEDETAIIVPGSTLKFKKVDAMEKTDQGPGVIYIDPDTITYPLQVRKWNQGDYFYPFGMKGKKKLSKFFKDEKLSLLDKEKVWILCSENRVVWVVGYRSDDRFKVTSKTQKVLKITVTT